MEVNKAYRVRIRASKASHDDEMRAFAKRTAHRGKDQTTQALIAYFKGIDSNYAEQLAGEYCTAP